MVRILLAAFTFSQLQVLAAPALTAHAGHIEVPACEDVAVLHAGASHLGDDIDCDDADCQECDMPGCEAMLGCAGVTAFAAPTMDADVGDRLVRAGQIEPAPHHDRAHGPPTLPPPRA